MNIRWLQLVMTPLVGFLLLVLSAAPAGAQTACGDTPSIRVKSGKIQLTWALVAGTTAVTVQRSENVAGPFADRVTLGGAKTAFVDANVVLGPTYYYRLLRTVNGSTCLSGMIGARLPSGRTRMAAVPDTVGDSQAVAAAEIAAASLLASMSSAHNNLVPPGHVISQDPPAGSVMPTGSAVAIVLSLGVANVTVPDVVGDPEADATSELQALGLVVSVETANDAVVPVGHVIDQDPAADSSVAPGTTVTLTVSLGPAGAIVPDVVGDPQAGATTELQGLGFNVSIVTANDATVPEGHVISQDPVANSSVAQGSTVTLTISLGPANVTVPDVVGDSEGDATTELQGLGFSVSVIYANNAVVTAGNVVSQDPVADSSVAPGTTVTLSVSLGPASVLVPDVVGDTQASATSELQGLGFGVSIVTANHATVPAGNVISQDPIGGSSVAPGSTVTLTISLGPANVVVPDVVGDTQASATTELQGLGFSVSIVTANHATVPAGNVISQDPLGGSSVAPGSTVTLTVSLGAVQSDVAALEILLNQALIDAGGSSSFVASALDAQGDPVAPAPAITFEILAEPNGTSGTLPTVNGTQIVTSADTRGAYRLRGTVDGTAVADEVLFSVVDASAAETNIAKFVTLGQAQGTAQNKLAELVAAFESGNTAAIPAINAALQAAKNTVVITGRNRVQLSTAVAPEQGFLPSTAMLIANGYPETADDAAFGVLLQQIAAKLSEITVFFNTLNPASPNDDNAKLNTLNAQLAALEEQLAELDVTPHGVVKYATRINALMANSVPAHLHAVIGRINTVVVANGLASATLTPKDYLALTPATPAGPAAFYASTQPAFFGLAGMFGGASLQMNLVNRIYGPIMAQVSRMMVLLAADALLQAYSNGGALEGIITGGSLSFHAYDIPGSVIEGYGFNRESLARNDVFLVGTAAVSAVEGLFDAFNPSEIESLQDVVDFFDGIVDAIEGAGEAYQTANQLPGGVFPGCILDGGSNPACTTLEYPSGFSSVSSCGGFFCFPEPVIVIHRNLDTGSFSFGIFNFVP